MIATCLLSSGVKINVVDPPGDEELWSGRPEELDELFSGEVDDPPEFFETHSPPAREVGEAHADLLPDDPVAVEGSDDERTHAFENADSMENREPLTVPEVVNIPDVSKKWFARVLANISASSVLLFAGAGTVASQYRVRQRRESAESPTLALEMEGMEVDTARHFAVPGGFGAYGTRYSMALPGGGALEVHKGIEEGLYDSLARRKLGSYFRAAHSVRERWSETRRSSRNAGSAVSVGRDGTVLMMRISD